jgi:hypothetical protein
MALILKRASVGRASGVWKRFPSLSRHLGSKAVEEDRSYTLPPEIDATKLKQAQEDLA